MLGVHPLELDVPELGVRHEVALDEHGAPDPGAEGEDEHHALPPGDSETELGDPGGVGIVEQDDGAADGFGEQLAAVHTDPIGVDVGRRENRPLPHHTREGAPHRTVP